MAPQEVYLTREGLAKLQEELDELINVRRPSVARKIHDAKMDGDVSENAGYDEAKNEQAFVEGRIMTLEQMIARAVIIDSKRSDVVQLGSQVTVLDEDLNEEEHYTIVGSAEADPTNGRISNESPIGRALMGRKRGDRVSVTTPGGMINFQVTRIA